MRANAMRRLAKIEDAVRTMPLSDALVNDAFEAFRATGELPEHGGLAAAVVYRALNGDAAGRLGSLVTYIDELGHAVRVSVQVCTHPPEPRPVPPREILFREAVHGQIDVKMAARRALTELVAAGADVADPTWLMRHPVPEFGSLGMSLLGWPDKVVVAPYEAQGKRLLARIEASRNASRTCPSRGLRPYSVPCRRSTTAVSCRPTNSCEMPCWPTPSCTR